MQDSESDSNKILILDFGSQYTQLIARRIRELKVYCEIHPYDYDLEQIKAFEPAGIVFSGGPASVTNPNSPRLDGGIFDLGVPIMGICYGLQLIAAQLGGKVSSSKQKEYGRAEICIEHPEGLFSSFSKGESIEVWMSHGDRVETQPQGFIVSAASDSSPYAAISNIQRNLYGVQFHPEVAHTPRGDEILSNFVFEVCGCEPTWTMHSFIQQTISRLREQIGDGKVICALSGGVDSSVLAALLHLAIEDRMTCIFVDNGLLRKNEAAQVSRIIGESMKIPMVVVDARQRFLDALAGVEDPEEKRKIIGHEFIHVFEEEANKITGARYLAQGTLYPDVIESISVRGPSATIKSHHNVGGLPDIMDLELIEPLRELFKDEVRMAGAELGMHPAILKRHPFPGPGLAVRIVGEVTHKRLGILREADWVFMQELARADWTDRVWQAFCVLLPVRTVGVMGDERTYENVVALRAVYSTDGMTADWAALPYELLGRVANRIINEVAGINRVVYDISSKPPATIEWE